MAKIDSSINSADILNFLDANEICHFITPVFHYSITLLDCWTVGNRMNYVSSQKFILRWLRSICIYLGDFGWF